MIHHTSEYTTNARAQNNSAAANIFDAAYGLPARETSNTTDFSPIQDARSAYTAAGGRLASDAWTPPVLVADASAQSKESSVQPADASAKSEGVSEPPAESAVPPKIVDMNGKPIDTSSLPPELQNEAALMQNLTGAQRTIVDRAFSNVGQKLWAQSEHKDLTGNGAYGCAASESIINQQSGFEYADSPLVSGLVDKLMKNGWTKHPYEDRQPGDKVVRHRQGSKWKNGGGRAHIGTVGADTNYAYNNDSATGKWSYEPIAEVFDRQKRFVLRAPQDGIAVAKGR